MKLLIFLSLIFYSTAHAMQRDYQKNAQAKLGALAVLVNDLIGQGHSAQVLNTLTAYQQQCTNASRNPNQDQKYDDLGLLYANLVKFEQNLLEQQQNGPYN